MSTELTTATPPVVYGQVVQQSFGEWAKDLANTASDGIKKGGGLTKMALKESKIWIKNAFDVFCRSSKAVPNVMGLKTAALLAGTGFVAFKAMSNAHETKAACNMDDIHGSVTMSGAQTLLNGGAGLIGAAAIAGALGAGGPVAGLALTVANSCPWMLSLPALGAFGIRNFAALALGEHSFIKHTQAGLKNPLFNYDVARGPDAVGSPFHSMYEAIRKLDRKFGVEPIDMSYHLDKSLVQLGSNQRILGNI